MAKNGETTLACKVTTGMFASERGVLVEFPDGRKVEALVDERNVIVSRDPQPGAEVPGRVKVSVVEMRRDSAVVDLPQGGIAAGPRLRVPKALLR